MKKTNKRTKKYTALVPKTLKATKNMGKTTVKRVRFFLQSTMKHIKNAAKMVNSKTADTIKYLTGRKRKL